MQLRHVADAHPATKMQGYTIRRGLDLPISGAPDVSRIEEKLTRRVGVLGDDSIGLRARLAVEGGQRIRKGQLLFEDARNRGVRYTAPGSGIVNGIHRGERRRLVSIVLELDDSDENGSGSSVPFESWLRKSPDRLNPGEVCSLLLESGLWTAIRVRPYSKVANPEQQPHSIFVAAIDTYPLAPPVERLVDERSREFEIGLSAIANLREVPVYVCKRPGARIPAPADNRIHVVEFDGPHPAGLPGTHIHLLDPVRRDKIVWWIHYQDVIAMGRLFDTGQLDVGRTISLAGPSVRQPRLLRNRLGASVDEVIAGELIEGDHRVISGSVLSGRIAAGAQTGYLGRYHVQVSALPEYQKTASRGLFGNISLPGALMSRLLPARTRLSSAAHGPLRPSPPLETLETVMPLNLLPVPLLRSLAASNPVQAEELGCLELDEEDLALCTFVDPGKTDWGHELRQMLTLIEKEG